MTAARATPAPRHVFITGATGYVGSRTAAVLVARGHRVRALVRSTSVSRVPQRCDAIVGDALDAGTWAGQVVPCDTLVHLVGVPHPSPAKARQFIDIDLRSVRQSAVAARDAGVTHFVYVSVAQPAPVMREYQDARRRGEEAVAATGIAATIVRPWYVLGPGHRWPYALVPLYAFLERIPSTRDAARRLGLVTIDQMVSALVDVIEHPGNTLRVLDVPLIKDRGARLHVLNA